MSGAERRPLRVGATVALLLLAAAGRMGWARAEEPSAAAPAPDSAKFTSAQLEQLVAPIALHPESLKVQTLAAATYPLEFVEATRWRKMNASLKDAALDYALEGQVWDPSVESLT